MLDSQLFQRWDSFPEGKNPQINVFILWFYQLFPSFSCAEEKGKENSSATEASPLGERCSSEDASIHKGQREPRHYKHTHKWGWGRTGSRKKKTTNKKSSFFTTHYYGTKRILMHFQQGIESPQYLLCVSWQFKNANAPRPRGARTNLLPRDTKLISRVYKAVFGNVRNSQRPHVRGLT